MADDWLNQQLLREPLLQAQRHFGTHLDHYPVGVSRTRDRRTGNIAEPLLGAYSVATRFAPGGNNVAGQIRILRSQLTGTCNAGMPRPA
jgi:hypothetical protein